jgi:hypothetical protein
MKHLIKNFYAVGWRLPVMSREFLEVAAVGAICFFVWPILTFALSGPSGWALLASSIWNSALLCFLFWGARYFSLSLAVKAIPASKKRLMHVAAAICFATLWTLLGEETWVVITEHVLEGPLERFAFFDAIEDHFDQAEDVYTGDPVWVVVRFVLGLFIYILGMASDGLPAIPATQSVDNCATHERNLGTQADDQPHFYVRDGAEHIRLILNDIVLIEGERDYVRVHVSRKDYLIRHPLKKFEETLEGSTFIRIHRSRIVNFAHVASHTPIRDGRWSLTLSNGKVVETSRDGGRRARDYVNGLD